MVSDGDNLNKIIKFAKKLVDEGSYQEAVNQYSVALNINPNNDCLYYKKGMALMKLGSFNTAIYNFAKAMKISPQNPEYYYQYGVALNEMKDYKQAEKMFSIANKLNPEKYPKHKTHYNSMAEEIDLN